MACKTNFERERQTYLSSHLAGLDRFMHRCAAGLVRSSGNGPFLGDDSVTSLTQRFAEINQRIENTMTNSQTGGGDHLITLLRQNDVELNSMPVEDASLGADGKGVNAQRNSLALAILRKV